MHKKISSELIKFIQDSPSCFHAVKNMKNQLKEAGYEILREENHWNLKEGSRYCITRNDSSIIAFQIPQKHFSGFQIAASHSDSPSFKVKENPEIVVENHYVKLNVEKYGGMILAPWFDRPLSVAGRVILKEKEKLSVKLVNIDKDLLMIPNVAIHMNKDINDGYKYNPQVDMLPLLGAIEAKDGFKKILAEYAGGEPQCIIGMDLYLYNRQKGCIWGLNDEYISSPKLDDLQCAFASLQGFLKANNTNSVPVFCVFDNEEVGSGTKQGAASTFLKDTLSRINDNMGRTREEYKMALASSFMISADNAHALHPNHAEKTDSTNKPFMNEGIVIKHSANQKYTTDAVSAAIFKALCEKINVPYQSFVNRSDMSGGSTLGNISSTQVAINSVDIGLAQLAMHSPYEIAGVRDTQYLAEACKEFFSTEIKVKEKGYYL